PARQVTVLPALATSAPDAAVAAAPAGAPRGNGYIALTTPGGHATDWRTLAIVAFSLWLLTLAGWWVQARGAHRAVPARAGAAPAGASTQRAAFLRACALGDLAGCERALVAWARSER